jgi:hypothetical protein
VKKKVEDPVQDSVKQRFVLMVSVV